MIENLTDIAVFVLLWFISVFLHEVGHLIGAKLGKLKFNDMCVGPFHFNFEDKLKVKLNKNLYYSGGVCLNFDALNDYTNLTNRLFKAFIGGPIMSFVLGVTVMIINVYIKNSTLTLFAMISVAIAFMTCFSDLRRGLQIKKNNDLSKSNILALLISSKKTDETLFNFTEKHFTFLGEIHDVNKSSILDISLLVKLKLVNQIKVMNVDIIDFVDKAVKDKNVRRDVYLYNLLLNSIIYIVIEKANIEKAKHWNEYLNTIKVPKGITLDYDRKIIESLLENSDIKESYVLLEKISNKYLMKGYTDLEIKTLEKIEKWKTAQKTA